MAVHDNRSHLTRVGWLFLCAALIMALAASVDIFAPRQMPIEIGMQASFHVVASIHFLISLCFLPLVFSAVWFGLSSTRLSFSTWALYLQFGLLVIGLVLAFFPQVILGADAMSRRYIDYADAFARRNALAAGGLALIVTSLVVFALMLGVALTKGRADRTA